MDAVEMSKLTARQLERLSMQQLREAAPYNPYARQEIYVRNHEAAGLYVMPKSAN